MFTGIIQAVGHIEAIESAQADIRLTIQTGQLSLTDVVEGDSIAVNGVCLTAVSVQKNYFHAHVSQATLMVTTGLATKQAVNLEKALRLSDRLGGHLVSGHIDGIGIVTEIEILGDCWRLSVTAPHAISKYIARKGSIAINGVSLTVNSVVQDQFTVNIVPHTLHNTTFANLKVNDAVNLEIDQIARYVERMANWSAESP